MATFNKLIPQASDLLSQSQADLLNNNTALSQLIPPLATFLQVPIGGALPSPFLVGNYYMLSKTAPDDWFFIKKGTDAAVPINKWGSTTATNGYSYLASGFITQWDMVKISSDSQAVTFALTFPTAITSLVISQYQAGAGGDLTYKLNLLVTAKSTSGFTFKSNWTTATHPSDPNQYIFYQAIGY